MQKIEATSPEAQSADLVSANIEQLKKLFPELLTESANGVAVNVDVLKALVGDQTATDADEKYGLNWHGKRRARQLALTPSTGTLRPCPDESVDWDTTQNLMIEGDNLEVLKLLQKSYASKVKLIYIDPPYNTGKDFVYPDNFQDNIKNYLELTGQTEGGAKISSNTEASGRFHTDWLNMMYPRLKLARNLLSPNGAIFVSCDDNEAPNLRALIEEIFGIENFVAQIVWEKMYTTKNDSSLISASHDYVIVALNGSKLDGAMGALPRTKEMDDRYSNPDNDPRGPWKAIPLYAAGERKNGRYPVVGRTGIVFLPPANSHWRYAEEDLKKLGDGNRLWFGRDGDAQPNLKRFLSELDAGVKAKTLWTHKEVGSNDTASRELKSLMEVSESPFSFPKPTSLISRILELGAPGSDEIVLDFFAGSGTTGHATLLKNSADQIRRRYILVQLPEPLDPNNKEQKAAVDYCDTMKRPRNIAELTKERLRRAASKIRATHASTTGATAQLSLEDSIRPVATLPDLGFRVFKLDQSNIRAWNPKPDDLAQAVLEYQDNLLPDRTESDILYELLLKLGLDLCVPIATRQMAGLAVHAVGGGVLMACLAPAIASTEVDALATGIVAWRKELAPAGDTTCVFRDSAFADDIAKTNLSAILEQHGIQNVRSL
ncbi:MAG: site-specific DNA-methyltransferase [Rhodoferax ferrireducens]|uniref:site-specific DNA-methyltransferase (adenine-specific) n=1 Tax=Rhodoferax ferrireducens TaxID=192843 RepID=A0A1W9KTB3_9BURK|nr:MAG: site-specific DNA-methyltransferase [Rhodoferax ferrireducens]